MTDRSPLGHRYCQRLTLALAWVVGFSALAQAVSVRAEYRLGVLQLESEDIRDHAFAPAFMQALRGVLRDRKDIRFVDTHVSLTQLSVAQDCDTAETTCLTRIARGLELDGFLFGKWTREGGVPVAIVRRYDARKEIINASALTNFSGRDANQPALQREAQKLVLALLGPPRVGEREHAPTVAQSRDSERPQPTAAAATAATKGPARADSGFNWRAFGGYTLLVAAAASAGMAVYSFVQVDHAGRNDQYERYRTAVGDNNLQARDVCDEAEAGNRYGLSADAFRDVKNSCRRGTTFEILQFVFIGGAVMTGGLATLLLVGGGDEHPQQHARFQLRPVAARSGMGVNAKFSF